NMVFAYDWGWEEPNFQGPARTAPGLVGLVVLETEPGTAHVLNGWRNVSGETPDWGGGRSNEFRGLGMMSGRNPYAPVHTDPGIGHTPESPGDVRLLISSGPFVLAPGDSASMTLAVVIAEPIPGTFTVGLGTPPGNPRDPDRAILEIAAGLLERARAARDLLPLFVQNDEGEASAPLHAARRGRNDQRSLRFSPSRRSSAARSRASRSIRRNRCSSRSRSRRSGPDDGSKEGPPVPDSTRGSTPRSRRAARIRSRSPSRSSRSASRTSIFRSSTTARSAWRSAYSAAMRAVSVSPTLTARPSRRRHTASSFRSASAFRRAAASSASRRRSDSAAVRSSRRMARVVASP